MFGQTPKCVRSVKLQINKILSAMVIAIQNITNLNINK